MYIKYINSDGILKLNGIYKVIDETETTYTVTSYESFSKTHIIPKFKCKLYLREILKCIYCGNEHFKEFTNTNPTYSVKDATGTYPVNIGTFIYVCTVCGYRHEFIKKMNYLE